MMILAHMVLLWSMAGDNIHAGKKDKVDIPAVKVPIPKEEQSGCGPTPCDYKTHTCLAICTPPETEEWGCHDKRRILEGPDGNGKMWCHLPQEK
jgi:hypothetical protein